MDGTAYQELGACASATREDEVEGRPVKDDDIVTLDYAGTVDGVAFEHSTAEKRR